MNVHLSFEDGWKVLEQGIVTCSKILEGSTGTRPTVAEYMNCYEYDSIIITCNMYILTITSEALKFVAHDMSIYFSSCAYRMAVQTTSYCEEMYNGYKATLAESVRALVCPHLMHQRDGYLLRQLAKMWSNYCIMVKCVSGFFNYLDRCFVEQRKLPCLEDTAATSFFSTVFSFFSHEVSDALLTSIRQERDGINADMDILMGIMRGICRSEVKSFMKNAVVQDTYAYYSRKSSEWIVQYPLQDYLAKVQDCMEKETMRLMSYLSIAEGDSTELCLKVVSAPLMQTYDSYAREKQIGGQLLLQTYKTVEDDLLARCNRLTIDSGVDNSSGSYME
ncbi:cullin-1-like isoform X1 [Triticum urartu]|uniref:cullin-1-like isoform X1 n=1 Tax=Triticum dicoccoides TaxID=85692 RepID=UPI00188F57F0|nr:cullin-1-like isoform X1 [Triticum dicoccoides]XP_037408166.1 cullin-1-like isoform X1 [Triticum dicoccoides]XP_044342955.1 cullin-1-like isoform X1 [Triticum aestivum]XP_048550190.1 cullin-1-like isoform X1 [Triticum urartu]